MSTGITTKRQPARWPRNTEPIAPAEGLAPISILFPAFNRLEYTRQSWAALIENTDWSLVKDLLIWDDGSEDGTAEWLLSQAWPECDVAYHCQHLGSPMAVTLAWIKASSGAVLAKLDNDTVVPPGWLTRALAVIQRNPTLDMLGIEAMYSTRPGQDGFPAAYRTRVLVERGAHKIYPWADEKGYNPYPIVSGIGLYRRRAFAKSLPYDEGYAGFERWMADRHLVCGWIKPSLPVFLLDRLPMEPWCGLSELYIERGWQRDLSVKLRYPKELSFLWDWWKPCGSEA